MTDPTTQPITEDEEARIRAFVARGIYSGAMGDTMFDRIEMLLAEVDRLRAEAAERESGHKGALDAMWDTVLQADAETAALRSQIDKVLSEANSWDLTDEQIDQLASDSHPVRRAEQWLKLTSYRACAESLKTILAVHHCLKCGKAMDVEHTTEFVVHMVRHEDDRRALGLDQDGSEA